MMIKELRGVKGQWHRLAHLFYNLFKLPIDYIFINVAILVL